jgi:hypothetical protein
MAAWMVMWTTAAGLYAACKWLSFRDARTHGVVSTAGRSAGYLLLWPGMDADAFL